MTSPRAVDRGELLRHAVEVFWRKGYGGTSVQDLVKALGLHRASLYETFRSKEDLFGEVVRRYSDLMFETVFEPLGGTSDLPPHASPRQRLAEFMEQAARTLCEGEHHGCLVENAVLAHGGDLGRARGACLEHIERVENKLADVIRSGQERGEFRADAPAHELARIVRAALSGMVFVSLVHRDPEALRPIREGVLRALV